MPCIVDVRDEKQVQKAVDEAVKKVIIIDEELFPLKKICYHI